MNTYDQQTRIHPIRSSFSEAWRHLLAVRAITAVAALVGTDGMSVVLAQSPKITFTPALLDIHSGVHDGRPGEVRAAYRHRIEADGAAWLRLRIGDYHLGRASYITLTSTSDGDSQRFDAQTLPEWHNLSGIFNGGSVVFELHVAPGDKGVFVDVDEVIMGEYEGAEPLVEPPDGGVASLCFGDDDRGASFDARVGRIWFNAFNGVPGGCTAWLVSNGAVLTAGHCVDSDPDNIANTNCGAGIPSECCTAAVPDGVPEPRFFCAGPPQCTSASNAVVEFNVPPSLANGLPLAAALVDQYPVDGAYIAWQYPGCDQNSSSDTLLENGKGTDWAVFSVGRNPNSLLTPHIAQSAFHRVADLACLDDCLTCVTGFGIDNTPAGPGDSRCRGGANQNLPCINSGAGCNASSQCPGGACCSPPGGGCNGVCNSSNFTQQSACGPYQDFHSDGSRRWHEYKTDTTGATSGSPVTVSAGPYEYAIGINTHSGCPDNGNNGTSFIQATLNQSLTEFLGVGTVHADSGWGPCIGACDGTVFEPHPNVAAAVQAVGDGRIVAVVRGSYPAADGNTFTAGADGKSMTLMAPVGAATIGN